MDVVFADSLIEIDAILEKFGRAFGLASHHDVYYSRMVFIGVNKKVFALCRFFVMH